MTFPTTPTRTLCHSTVLLGFIVLPSTAHHLTSEVVLCLFAYCLCPPHVALRSGTPLCSQPRKYLENSAWHTIKIKKKKVHSSNIYRVPPSCWPLGDNRVPGRKVGLLASHIQLVVDTQSLALKRILGAHPSSVGEGDRLAMSGMDPAMERGRRLHPGLLSYT